MPLRWPLLPLQPLHQLPRPQLHLGKKALPRPGHRHSCCTHLQPRSSSTIRGHRRRRCRHLRHGEEVATGAAASHHHCHRAGSAGYLLASWARQLSVHCNGPLGNSVQHGTVTAWLRGGLLYATDAMPGASHQRLGVAWVTLLAMPPRLPSTRQPMGTRIRQQPRHQPVPGLVRVPLRCRVRQWHPGIPMNHGHIGSVLGARQVHGHSRPGQKGYPSVGTMRRLMNSTKMAR